VLFRSAVSYFQNVLNRAHNPRGLMAIAQRDFLATGRVVGPLLQLLEAVSLGMDMAAFNTAFLLHSHVADDPHLCELIFSTIDDSTPTPNHPSTITYTVPTPQQTQRFNHSECMSKLFDMVVPLYESSASPTNAQGWVQLANVFFSHHQHLHQREGLHKACHREIAEPCLHKAMLLYQEAAFHHDPEALFNLAWAHTTGITSPKDLHLAKRYVDLLSTQQHGSRLAVWIGRAMLRLMTWYEVWWKRNPEYVDPVAKGAEGAGTSGGRSGSGSSSEDTVEFKREGDAMSFRLLNTNSSVLFVLMSMVLGLVIACLVLVIARSF